MYIGTFFKIVFSLILAVMSLLPTSLGLPVCAGGPTVYFDAQSLTGEVTNGASGYLYGIAEDGVPSHNMVESLDIASVSAKTQGGLQHPIGEVGDIADSLLSAGHCDYIVVYLQDMFSTWYYEDASITEMKKNNEYDWEKFLKETYFPLIEETVSQMKNTPYSDKLVYCIFNECDNGVWFGKWVTDGENGWHSFDDEDRDVFNKAWKMTYDYVKSLVPDAKIGGPGNYEYNRDKTEKFLKFTSENSCVPEVMIYHELDDRSVYDWETNVNDLKELETKYGIAADTPIIITEYGRMQDNGNPNTMLKYIVRTENSKVYSDQAYWLFADNLCSTAADYNTPNSAWWVYRWYTSLEGQTMKSEISDILHSDLGKALKEKREPRYQQLMGLGTIDENGEKIEILVSGADYNSRVVVKNLENTALFGKNVKIEITAVTYQGILGKVYAPETVKTYDKKCGKQLSIPLETNSNTAYRIVVTAGEAECEENENMFIRYEAEEGTLLGNSYTYDSAYATTGETNGMVGGMEQAGDGVKLTVNAKEDGEYLLRIIYGKANDGQASGDRSFAKANLLIDGGEENVITLNNTIRSEITDYYDFTVSLEKGKHTVTFTNNTGTFVLDSILVKKNENSEFIYSEKDADRENGFLVLADKDGYYELCTGIETTLTVDGANAKTDKNGNTAVYLRRGINYIDADSRNVNLSIKKTDKKSESIITLIPSDALLSGDAVLKRNDALNAQVITGISNLSGSAEYTVNAAEDGVYKLTVTYSNNRENGVHAYNVDLVEDYITIFINGTKSQNLYCRNTYSGDTFTTVTANITLKKGENVLTFGNDGVNLFNSGKVFAPDIAKMTINPVTA